MGLLDANDLSSQCPEARPRIRIPICCRWLPPASAQCASFGVPWGYVGSKRMAVAVVSLRPAVSAPADTANLASTCPVGAGTVLLV